MTKLRSDNAANRFPVSVELVQRRIYLIRGRKVMLDSHLADLYQVETFNLNKAVKRNLDRFPEDFMLQLTKEEFKNLTFQTGISRWGGRRHPPYAFTEHGVAMLSSVLNSQRAIHVNIAIMRAFGQLREMLAGHKDLAHKLEQLEKKMIEHDRKFAVVFTELRKLLEPPPPLSEPPRKPIGFKPPEK